MDGELYAQLTRADWIDMQNQFGLYQVSAVSLFFVILATLILFRGAFPFVWSKFVTHEPIVGVLTKSKAIVPKRGFTIKNNMYYYNGEPLPFVKRFDINYWMAGVQFDITLIDLETIQNPAYKAKCVELQKMGYRDIHALEFALWFNTLDRNDPRVLEIMERNGYESYQEACDAINPAELNYRDDIVQVFFSSIPLSELIGYGADVPPEDILGEVDDIYEARKPSAAAMKRIRDIIPYCVIIMIAATLAVLLINIFS